MSAIHQIAAANLKAIDDISATDAILFSLRIDDHYNRLYWLQMWVEGSYAEMHKEWPDFKRVDWRHDQNWRTD